MHSELADKFLSKYWFGEVPVDVRKLCALAGIEVIYSNSVEISSVDTEKRKIFINGINSEERIRFCIAHSVGHILLGHESHDESVDNFSSLGYDSESDANRFSIDLLVPPKVLKYCVGNGMVRIELLCSKFLVSEVLMATQLKSVFKILR